MNVQISLGDLGIMLLGTALLVLIIYAICLLKNLNDTVKVFKKVLQNNQYNIDKILDQAPSIAQNIESISSDLSNDVKAIQGTINQIVGTTEVAASTLAENNDVLSKVIGAIQIIYSIREFFNGFKSKKIVLKKES
ncbi:hypothetical protein FQB35_14535 [Crassaminicella thermophila]|uniref:DUF948 domain-containing protein n=1 Tax=Crassaminicella thermophila TaxID=2599308 RepID=A0A5C0SGR4_CRATE|nr:hypothetical protein [Crassaminicella thermophila]QEK13390.1 hypothetical protein FQB35_14535 [Crassaminicella thermophila]